MTTTTGKFKQKYQPKEGSRVDGEMYCSTISHVRFAEAVGIQMERNQKSFTKTCSTNFGAGLRTHVLSHHYFA